MKKPLPIRKTQVNFSRAFQRAAQLHQQCKLDQAETLCTAILAGQPNHFDAMHLLGVLRFQQHRNAEALDHISAALKLKPTAVAALTNFGLVLAKSGRPEEALASFDKALALKPNYTEALNNRGATLRDLKRFDDALASFDKALAIKPDYAEALNNRGTTLWHLKRFDDALASYDTALAINPDYAEALNNRGATLRDLKRFDDALACFDRARSFVGENAVVQFNRGYVLAYLGRNEEAIDVLNAALASAGVSILERAAIPAPVAPSVVLRGTGETRGYPTTATVFPGPKLIVEQQCLSRLIDTLDEWHLLATRSLEPNVFIEPAFARATLEIYHTDVNVLLVWSTAMPRKLMGFLPFHIQHDHPRLPGPVLQVWHSHHAAIGTPLIDRDTGALVLQTIFDHILASATLPNIILFPHIQEDGPFAVLLRRIIASRGDQIAMYGRYKRALFKPCENRDTYIETALSGKRRKKLRWQWRQLGESGRVETATTTESTVIHKALSDYFAIEASGWKGRAGTAAARKPKMKLYIEQVLSKLATEGKVRIDRLLIGDRPIAASILLLSGGVGWLWKIAFDEAYARFSPGFFNVLNLTEALLTDRSVISVDSSTIPDHPLLDRLWLERLAVGHCMVGLGPDANAKFEIACRIEGFVHKRNPYYIRLP
jgi:Tfp pilus assembly protein PilF/CelD/BcsL family acetyltransferase involved in cellulose biosynthesis